MATFGERILDSPFDLPTSFIPAENGQTIEPNGPDAWVTAWRDDRQQATEAPAGPAPAVEDRPRPPAGFQVQIDGQPHPPSAFSERIVPDVTKPTTDATVESAPVAESASRRTHTVSRQTTQTQAAASPHDSNLPKWGRRSLSSEALPISSTGSVLTANAAQIAILLSQIERRKAQK